MKLYMEPIGRDGEPLHHSLSQDDLRLTTLKPGTDWRTRAYRRSKRYLALMAKMSIADPDNRLRTVAVRIKTGDGELVETVIRGYFGKATRVTYEDLRPRS